MVTTPKLLVNTLLNPASLGRKTINSAFWTTGGYAFGQILRFGSNLILTRMLVPEFFGVMALVNVFLIGLNMFSDIGLGPNVIQNPRSKDPNFLNITWTIQILRGLALWTMTAILAYPFAAFYNEPILISVLPVAGLTTIIAGFTSTNMITNNRDLNMLKLTLVDVATQITTIVTMIGLATIKPTVWVLVAGSLTGASLKVILSHTWLPGIRNRLKWEIETVKEQVNFGKWVFFSTLLSFASNSMASLIMGKLVSMSEVGIFSIAVTLAKTAEGVFDQISNKVLFPVYNLIKNQPIEQIKRKVKKIRLGILALFLPGLWFMVIFGNEIINILFDDRYQGAGWILQIFALGIIPKITSGVGPFYLALGNSKLLMKVSAIKLVSYIFSITVGWYSAGVVGVVWGMGCSTVFVYFYDAYIQSKHKIWVPQIDALSFISTIVVLGTAEYIRSVL